MDLENDVAGTSAFAPLLALHQLVLDDARHMLELASRSLAREFNEKRDLYLQRLTQLRSLRASASLSSEQQARLATMLHELIVVDGHIRQYTDPQMAAIERWIMPGRSATPFAADSL